MAWSRVISVRGEGGARTRDPGIMRTCPLTLVRTAQMHWDSRTFRDRIPRSQNGTVQLRPSSAPGEHLAAPGQFGLSA